MRQAITILQRSDLGGIRGVPLGELTRFRFLPYATTRQRFARSKLLSKLPRQQGDDVFDATQVEPSSMQPKNAAKMDADSNQLPSDFLGEDPSQSEDCLRVTVSLSTICLGKAKLPVLVASMVELSSLIQAKGTLGFFPSKQATDLVTANIALHDQLRAFEWIREHIDGFWGDHTNMIAIGQLVGAKSSSLHNISDQKMPPYKRRIMFSGTPVTMPSQSPQEYEENFCAQVAKLDLVVKGRKSVEIATDIINLPVDSIRDLNFVGAPCPSSEILLYDRPTMQLFRGCPSTEVDWLQVHIVITAGYDGSISWIITKKAPKWKTHAKSFIAIATEVPKKSQQLLDLYDIVARGNATEEEDDEDLTKICRFESDIGFVAAAHAVARSATKAKTYFQFFDLPNPFEGYLAPRRYSTHSWDIFALLGAYHERLGNAYISVISEWRSKIINHCITGYEPWPQYKTKNGMLVTREGLGVQSLLDKLNGERRKKLDLIARDEAGEHGHHLLWEGLCRRWLDKGS